MQRIIIFDGICGLCNKSINLLIKLDTHKIFQYISLQGEFIKTLNIEPDIDSITALTKHINFDQRHI